MSTIHSRKQAALSDEAKGLIARLTAVTDLLPTVTRPALPESWQWLIRWRTPQLKPILANDLASAAALRSALTELDAASVALSGTDVPRLERAARNRLCFPGHHFLPAGEWLRYRDTVLTPLWAQHPTFAMLSALHGDGYIREAALRSLKAPLSTPLLTHILMARLLDWVPQVREQANACLERLIPISDPDFLAEGLLGALTDLPRRPAWRDAGLALFNQLSGTGIISLAARRLGQRRNGPGGMLLRRLLTSPEADELLTTLTMDAAQPAVRAVALRCLLAGQAHYPRGLRRKWIDKSMGRFTLVLDVEERPLAMSPPPRSTLILQGINDKAACVRRIALEAATREDSPIVRTERLRQMAEADPAGSVRDRASYLLRQQADDREE